ncbi:hypothetical protein [Saccharolobus shibatae]|uniref:Uncharacterized protein n=1 Tax=Saccharolobus shibatae TaxID=2286 RepID=A0A8F5C4B0_9CREN|nr:hypothetical protein [Saccharolobus shibatae]QXJ36590.1 putative protein DUF1905 [Saccharolobus shibatae]
MENLIRSFLIPKQKILLINNGKTKYYAVSIPAKFNDFLPNGVYYARVLTNDKVYEVGFRKIWARGTRKILVLPKALSNIWDELIRNNERVSIILEKL